MQRILGWTREQVYGELEAMGTGISAAVVYRYLQGKNLESVQKMGQEFFADDHRYWPKEEQRQAMPSPARNQWKQAAYQISLEQKRQGDDSEKGQRLLGQQMKAGQRRRSYRDFLKKFAVMREELKLDPDEFVDVERIDLREAVNMVLRNEIQDAKTQIALMKTYLLEQQKKQGM